MKLFVFQILALFFILSPIGWALNPTQDRPVGSPELVHSFDGPTPVGVAVSHSGRIFLTFPRAMDPGAYTVGELKSGQVVPYPSPDVQSPVTNPDPKKFVSMQGITIDSKDQLWLLDMGHIGDKPVVTDSPKLIMINLKTNQISKTINIPASIAGPQSYLNDIRISYKMGKGGTAFITDSATEASNAIVVVDLATGKAMRRLQDHPSTKAELNFTTIVEGRLQLIRENGKPPSHDKTGSDGISLNGDETLLYYCPNSGHHLHSASTTALANPALNEAQVAATVKDLGDRNFASDGLEADPKGKLYLTDYEHNSIMARLPNGQYDTVVHNENLVWPDSIAIGPEGWVYFTVNQLNRRKQFNNGKDLRVRPFALYRVKTDSQQR